MPQKFPKMKDSIPVPQVCVVSTNDEHNQSTSELTTHVYFGPVRCPPQRSTVREGEEFERVNNDDMPAEITSTPNIRGEAEMLVYSVLCYDVRS